MPIQEIQCRMSQDEGPLCTVFVDGSATRAFTVPRGDPSVPKVVVPQGMVYVFPLPAVGPDYHPAPEPTAAVVAQPTKSDYLPSWPMPMKSGVVFGLGFACVLFAALRFRQAWIAAEPPYKSRRRRRKR